MLLLNVIDVKLVHPQKVKGAMAVTLSGIVMFGNCTHS